MSLFGIIDCEEIIQVGDKLRIDVSKSFVTPDEGSINLLEIDPDGSATFYDVTSSRYLDFLYSTDGSKTVTVRVTSTNSGPSSFTKQIEVITEENDKLFSKDSELREQEHDILKYLPSGKSSFKFKHRAAQDRIIGYLDEKKIWDINGNRLTKDAIIDNEEVNDWSKFMVLMMIFEDLSNSTEDVFFEKSNRYRDLMNEARNRAVIRLDRNGDGEVDLKSGEFVYLDSIDAYRS